VCWQIRRQMNSCDQCEKILDNIRSDIQVILILLFI
jgi:hypothetical protein